MTINNHQSISSKQDSNGSSTSLKPQQLMLSSTLAWFLWQASKCGENGLLNEEQTFDNFNPFMVCLHWSVQILWLYPSCFSADIQQACIISMPGALDKFFNVCWLVSEGVWDGGLIVLLLKMCENAATRKWISSLIMQTYKTWRRRR